MGRPDLGLPITTILVLGLWASFSMDLPPGRYALVALPDAFSEPGPGDAAAGPAWLLWIEVREGAMEPLVLDSHNQHGTDCDACVVPVKEMR